MKRSLPKHERVSHDLSVSKPFLVYGAFRRDIAPSFYADAHYDVQLGVILSGGMEVLYHDFSLELRAGEFFLTSAWEPHACRVSRPNTAFVVVTLSLAALSAADIIGELEWSRPFFVPPARRPRAETRSLRLKFHQSAKDIYRLEQKKPSYYKTRQWQKINELLLLVISSWRANLSEGNNPRNSKLYSRLAPAVQLARENTGRLVSLDEAASACGLGRSAFAHSFTETLGVSFGRFAMRMRLTSASALLRNPGIPIKEIAVSSGFNGLSNFYHAFAKEFGCTPLEFRKRNPGGAAGEH